MGFFKKLFGAPGKADRRLDEDEAGPPRAEPDRPMPGGGPDGGVDDEERQRQVNMYGAWEELDDMRANFLIGSWAWRKIKGGGKGELHRDREAPAREKAEAEGREYKSRLQLELEAAAKKREEKEMRRAEKRRLKEERKKKS